MLSQTALALIADEDNHVPGGFANNLSLKESLNIIIPNTWEIQAPRSVLNKKVSWNGDVGWFSVLKSIAKDNQIDIKLDPNMNVITLLNSDPTMPPIVENIARVGHKNSTTTQNIPTRKPNLDWKSKTNHKTPPRESTKKKKSDSFFDTLMVKTTSLFKDNVPTPKASLDLTSPDNKNDQKLFQVLLDNLGLQTTVEDVIHDYNTSDNSRTFEFNYTDLSTSNKNRVSSLMVFNGVDVYSPILTYPADKEIAKLWYKNNYKHKALGGVPIISPITSETTQHKTNIVEKYTNTPPVIKPLPSILDRKEFLAKEGIMLSAIVKQWSESEGIDVIWESTSDFKITKSVRFFNNYLEAIKGILVFYNSTPTPFQTRFFVKNKTLLVQDLQVIYRKRSSD